MATPAYSKRATDLIKTARKLFAENGFHATGVDRILEECGAAKMTLYNNFGSKEALIIAVIGLESRRVIGWLDDALSKSDNAATALNGLFAALEDWFRGKSFRGSLIARATAEFPDPDHPIHRAAGKHYEEVLARLLSCLDAAGDRRARTTAANILICLEGATTIALATGTPMAARRAGRLVAGAFAG